MKKVLVILCLMLVLSGCETAFKKANHQVKTIENIDLEVNEVYNTCEWIEKVDDTLITKEMIKDNKIILDGFDVTCDNNYLVENIGENKISYDIEGTPFTMTLIAKDTKAPTITANDSYEVEAGNDYFNIADLVIVNDNYDSKDDLDITYDMGDFDPTKEGEYKISIVAIDTSGNEASKNTTIKVIPKEKEVVKVEVPVYVGGSGSNSSSSSKPSGSGSSGSSSGGSTSKPSQPSNDPYISGVHDVSVPLGSSINEIVRQLSGIRASSSVTIDYSSVNTTAKGTYVVYYYGADGASAKATVTIY